MSVRDVEAVLEELEALELVQPPDRHNFPSAASVLVAPAPADMATREADAATSLGSRPVNVRLLSCQILDNFDGFLQKNNEINLVGVVMDGSATTEPVQFGVGSFVGIGKNDMLPIGDSGVSLYFGDHTPRYLDLRLLIVEDDQDIRDVGGAIKHVQSQDAYQKLLDALTGIASPPLQLAVRVTSAIISLVGAALEQNKDDKISLFAATYTLAFDRLGVGRHTFHQDGRSRVRYEIRSR